MRLLVLGGSWFVGRAVVGEAIAREHEVTLFNRGQSAHVPPTDATLINGDRESRDDLARLASAGPWDAVIDVPGSVPSVVRDSARALRDKVAVYAFISTVSVYRHWPQQPVDEESPLHITNPDYDPGWRHWNALAYGPLKAGCEAAIHREYDDRWLFLRPGVVLGPNEYVGRTQWWLERFARGGSILAPGRADRPIQPVDGRDLATFALDRVEAQSRGVFNVAAPMNRDTYGDLLAACQAATGANAEIVWVDEDWLLAHDVAQWTELPLWRVQPGTWAMDATRAERAGLRCRPISQTIADTWSWLSQGGRAVAHERHAEHGIAPEKEAKLLELWAKAR